MNHQKNKYMKTRMILCAAALLSLAACGPKTTTLKGEFEAGKAPEFVNFVVVV